jgi:hypothetical protein
LSLTISVCHDNVSVFGIDTSLNFDNLSFFIGNVIVFVSEQLPPSGIDTRDSSQVSASTIVLDIKAIVLPVVVSDSLGDFIKPELLLSSVLSPSLEDQVGSTKHLHNSVEWKFRDDVEWSIDVEAKFFIESLGLSLSGFIKIDNLPSLVSSSLVI